MFHECKKKDNNGKTFLFLRNIKSFMYQKKELILSHFQIIFRDVRRCASNFFHIWRDFFQDEFYTGIFPGTGFHNMERNMDPWSFPYFQYGALKISRFPVMDPWRFSIFPVWIPGASIFPVRIPY